MKGSFQLFVIRNHAAINNLVHIHVSCMPCICRINSQIWDCNEYCQIYCPGVVLICPFTSSGSEDRFPTSFLKKGGKFFLGSYKNHNFYFLSTFGFVRICSLDRTPLPRFWCLLPTSTVSFWFLVEFYLIKCSTWNLNKKSFNFT